MLYRKILPLLLCAVLLGLALAGCGTDPGASSAAVETGAEGDPGASREADASSEAGEPEEAEPLRVVTTIFPPYDFVRQIAGDRVELTMLLSPGAESHSFDPSPQDLIAIQECDLFLYIGGDTDVWVDRILGSIDRDDLRVLALMDLVDVVEEELVEGMEHSHDGHGHDDDHQHSDGEDHDDHDHDDEDPELDEHVWTNPANAVRIVRSLTETLCELDPDGAALYRENSGAYVGELEQLDADFREMIGSSRRRLILFGDRFPFRYLADAYGLEYYAAFPGCSTDTEASAATVAFLIDKVRDEALPVVFYIELSNQKMADTICGESGAKKLQLHSCHNVTRDEFEAGETYLSLMRRNLVNLEEALN